MDGLKITDIMGMNKILKWIQFLRVLLNLDHVWVGRVEDGYLILVLVSSKQEMASLYLHKSKVAFFGTKR